jgi:lysylphosphatidylglycerol synthetase-like protein (DUF2156 family)
MYWLPLAVFLPHVAEEWPRFPEWATRHFGATSRPYYVYSHIVLIASNTLVCALAASGSTSTWALLATAAQVVLATNGVFHLTTTALFREYSPGVVTGTLLFFPATAYLLTRTVREHLLSPGELEAAVAIGIMAGAAVIASLWLKMDLDWRLRRTPHDRRAPSR